MSSHPNFTFILTILALLMGGEALGQGITWFAAGPITRIESTYIIPSVPQTPILNATQGFWMGLQPPDNNAVIQNVVGNRGIGVGQWGFWPEYCCQPNIFLEQSERVYPERILRGMGHELVAQAWTQWGPAREAPFAASLVFDPRLYPAKKPFQNAFFVIEVGNPSFWDFGLVVWEDILIEANTTETGWCAGLTAAGHSAANVWTVTTPNAIMVDGVTTCRVESLKLSGP
ncbi:hypothetical protein D0Z07_7940 [Hyphodiscus hymeniophilus]|uniref:Uncharacterized protein n=1 Tax=Hyphodiscus hymeniophilus TaxID=353542 RepID=A0A9P6VCI3_9HELO|nr:hypothetical protein D0Z07_7940 [Hyphodiscus hymeniophilus]